MGQRDVLYHYTRIENLPSILIDGIRPSDDGWVYLTDRAWGEGEFCINPIKRAARLTVRATDAVRRLKPKANDEFLIGFVPPSQIVSAELFCNVNLTGVPAECLVQVVEIIARLPHKSLRDSCIDSECGDTLRAAIVSQDEFKLTEAVRTVRRFVNSLNP